MFCYFPFRLAVGPASSCLRQDISRDKIKSHVMIYCTYVYVEVRETTTMTLANDEHQSKIICRNMVTTIALGVG